MSKPTATQSTDTAESYSLLAIWPPAVRGNRITAAAKKLISLPLWGSRACALVRLSVGCRERSFVGPGAFVQTQHAFWKACHPDSESVCLLDEDEGPHPTVLQAPEGEP